GARRRPRPPRRVRVRAGGAATWSRLTRRPPGRAGRRRDLLLLLGVLAGVATYLVTGIALTLVLVPVGVIGLPWLLADPSNRELELLRALDRWVRTMTATLQTGQSIPDALRGSVRQAPDLLVDDLRLVAARLNDRWTVREALLAMADSLDSPDADAVLAAMVLASERGGTGVSTTLRELSESTQDRLKSMREVEVERAKPRIVVRQVTVITVVALVAALFLVPDFFQPYTTPLGQALLAALLGAYAGALVWLRRLTAPARRERILTPEVPR
ncbi:type II secretion system F family protein, partial [Desertihabitans aurantiacus]|uniref:type II secretion system F family protein n=1 Tax=Desertihabitans aurantiacus TaxID=2282477 RepID=UPI000DF739C2